MRFVDFLKATVILSAGSATFLAALTIVQARQEDAAVLLEVARERDDRERGQQRRGRRAEQDCRLEEVDEAHRAVSSAAP